MTVLRVTPRMTMIVHKAEPKMKMQSSPSLPFEREVRRVTFLGMRERQ